MIDGVARKSLIVCQFLGLALSASCQSIQSGNTLIDSHNGRISKVLISLVGAESTVLPTTENISKDRVASFFLNRLKCDACLVWVQLSKGSVLVWPKVDSLVEFSFASDNDIREELNAIKLRFDSARASIIANSIVFELPLSEDAFLKSFLDNQWEKKLTNQVAKDNSVEALLDSGRFEIERYVYCYFDDGEFRVVAAPTSELFGSADDNLQSLIQLDAQWRVAYQQYVSTLQFENSDSTFNWLKCVSSRAIDPTMAYSYCNGLNLKECENLLRQSMYFWIQDKFNTVEEIPSTGISKVQSNYMPKSGAGISMSHVLSQFVGNHCSGLDTYAGNTVVQGGNILYSKDFALIGRDALSIYMNNNNSYAYEQIGLDSTTNVKDSIEERLKLELNLGARDIVWVGTNDSRDTYDFSHPKLNIPLFHIDMFLTLGPIKIIDGKKHITYLLGIPELANSGDRIKPGMDSTINVLVDWIKECRDSLNVQLQKIDHVPEIIEIPLPIVLAEYNPISYGPDFGWEHKVFYYYGFNNGLMECVNDSCWYLMPEIQTREIPPKHSVWGKRVKAKLDSAGIGVIPIFNSIESNWAIHCRVKVLNRQ